MSRDPKVENLLTKQSITWEWLDEVPFGAIDFKRSQENRARLEGMLPWLVERYALAMDEGDEFPAIVLFKGPNGYIVASGNHRTEAARKQDGWVTYPFGGYVADVQDPMVRDMLTREFNTREGFAHNEATDLAHALHGIKAYGFSQKEMAARFHIPATRIQAELHADQTRKRLVERGVDVGRGQVSRSALARLDGFDDYTMEAAYRLIEDGQLYTNEVEALIVGLHKAKNDVQVDSIIDNWRENPDIKARIQSGQRTWRSMPGRLSQHARLKGSIRALQTISLNLRGSYLSDEQRQELAEIWKATQANVESVLAGEPELEAGPTPTSRFRRRTVKKTEATPETVEVGS